MARFFLPPLAAAAAEHAYQALREEAEACTGIRSSDRRIHEIQCRHRGTDRRLRVGESDAANGKIVGAILQLGRDTYTIHHVQSDLHGAAPIVLRRTDVYSVIEFE